MQVYIRSAQAISPQDTFLKDHNPASVTPYNPFYECILPDFKDYFSPLERRRMSKLIKMGAACAIEAINKSGIEKPDAIISGTGLGSVEDTEKFLHNILQSEEGLLPPTSFVQSTHNSIGAMIAVKYHCKEYNVLYVQKTLSFEHALLDWLMQFSENKVTNVLVGGFDEITGENYELKRKFGIFKDNTADSDFFLKNNTPGSIAGEGTAYFVLSSEQSDRNAAEIVTVETLHKNSDTDQIAEWITGVLQKHNMTPEHIDVFLSGINGDSNVNKTCLELADNYFPGSNHAYYKHLCGEYDTASSFGMWFAMNILKTSAIPEYSLLRKKEGTLNTLLIYNQGSPKEHSLILLKRV